MSNKTQTSLWIENDLYYQVKSNDLNLTKWVNKNLRRFFCVSSVDEVKEKIREKEQEMKILEDKLETLKREGTAETKEEAVEQEVWSKLKGMYKVRRDRVSNFASNLSWINGPKNKERCSTLKLMPEDVLKKLEDWYLDQKEGNE